MRFGPSRLRHLALVACAVASAVAACGGDSVKHVPSGSGGTSAGVAGSNGGAGSGGTGMGASPGASGSSGMAGVSGGAGAPSCTALMGTLCVLGTAIDSGEALNEGMPLRLGFHPFGCFSSSCTEVVSSSLALEREGENFVANPEVCFVKKDPSLGCTEDCGGGYAEFTTEYELAPGKHTVRYEGQFKLDVTFTVPSVVNDGSLCSVMDL